MKALFRQTEHIFALDVHYSFIVRQANRMLPNVSDHECRGTVPEDLR
jgi:hypothetical protein